MQAYKGEEEENSRVGEEEENTGIGLFPLPHPYPFIRLLHRLRIFFCIIVLFYCFSVYLQCALVSEEIKLTMIYPRSALTIQRLEWASTLELRREIIQDTYELFTVLCRNMSLTLGL